MMEWALVEDCAQIPQPRHTLPHLSMTLVVVDYLPPQGVISRLVPIVRALALFATLVSRLGRPLSSSRLWTTTGRVPATLGLTLPEGTGPGDEVHTLLSPLAHSFTLGLAVGPLPGPD